MRTQTKFTQGLNLLASIIYSQVNILASIFWPCELDLRTCISIIVNVKCTDSHEIQHEYDSEVDDHSVSFT